MLTLQAEENLLVPIHAYPVMSTEEFPKDVHFSSVPVGERLDISLKFRY